MQTPFDHYTVEAQRIAFRQALEAMAKAKDEQAPRTADEEHSAAA